tara:strand:- start:3237 stop:3842 length:606 start_codon:yes stop_codon:yes gene_type:complete
VEGLSECDIKLKSMCGYTAGSGSCKDCNECLLQNWNYFSGVGCSQKTFYEFCSLPEQQQENTLSLYNDIDGTMIGKDKLMEILREYTSSLMKHEDKKLKLKFEILNGPDSMEINIANLAKEYKDNSIKMYGSASNYHNGTFEKYNLFSLEYGNEDKDRSEYFLFELTDIHGENLITIADNSITTTQSGKIGYHINFSYYLC